MFEIIFCETTFLNVFLTPILSEISIKLILKNPRGIHNKLLRNFLDKYLEV